jgi:response regulator of citrate/malate metabolism
MGNPSTIDALIVDDDKNICAIIKEYLESMRCFRLIVTANDGSIATQKLQNQSFALIILDMNMPKKSGVDLLKEFDGTSSTSNKIENILVISGTLDRDLIARVIQRGVKNFLVKPFDEASFKDKVSKIIGVKA